MKVARPALGIARDVFDREDGQTIPLLLLAMLMAIFAMAFLVDVGLVYRSKAQLQYAADLAALAAAQELPDLSAAVAEARAVARLNGFDDDDLGTDDPDVTVSVEISELTCFRPDHCVRVTISRMHHWTFGPLLSLADPEGPISAAGTSSKARRPRDVVFVIDRSNSIGGGELQGETLFEGIKSRVFQFSQSLHLFPSNGDQLGAMAFPTAAPSPVIEADFGPTSSTPLPCPTPPVSTPSPTPTPTPTPKPFTQFVCGLERQGGSGLADAIYTAMVAIQEEGQGGSAQRAIIVISDGDGTNCAEAAHARAHAADAAAAGITIHAILVRGSGGSFTCSGRVENGQTIMGDIAAISGGGLYPAPCPVNPLNPSNPCQGVSGAADHVGEQLIAIAQRLGIELTP